MPSFPNFETQETSMNIALGRVGAGQGLDRGRGTSYRGGGRCGASDPAAPRKRSSKSGRARSSPGRPSSLTAPETMTTVQSEEHTSELQSRENLVCRLPLEKKNSPGHEEVVTRPS